jgi:copper homeostasis protein (lipoprotein)
MKISVLLFTSALILLGCKTSVQQGNTAADSSRTSVDWAGTYFGTLPCSDCEGIRTQVQLRSDNTFEIGSFYLGKSEEVKRTSGKVQWDQSGGIVTLGDKNQQFRVGENRLIKLDGQGQKIESPLADKYVLMKNTFDDKITEKYWRLIELRGKPIVIPKEQQRETHIVLKEQENRVTGHGGCNSFFGTYELKGTTIRFSGIGSTQMACPNMDDESAFFQVLQQADNFTMKGDTLSLNKARMAPLARFVVVYLR